jgi:uncharacterized damage-inducible protein DinB
MENGQALREHLLYLLEGGGAHRDIGYTFRDVPMEKRGERPAGLPYSLWELLEHLRISQEDILDFSRNPDYEERDWPADYWPEETSPPSEQAWTESLDTFIAEQKQMATLVRDPDSDLFTPFPWGTGQTLLREALLIADHNAYHLGQVVVVRRLLGCWPPAEE